MARPDQRPDALQPLETRLVLVDDLDRRCELAFQLLESLPYVVALFQHAHPVLLLTVG